MKNGMNRLGIYLLLFCLSILGLLLFLSIDQTPAPSIEVINEGLKPAGSLMPVYYPMDLPPSIHYWGYPYPTRFCSPTVLYDQNGYAHPMIFPYQGPAPLYWPSRIIWELECTEPPYLAPGKFIMDTYTNTYYPFRFDFNASKNNIPTGESIRFSVEYQLDDQFRGDAPLRDEAVLWNEETVIQTSIYLNAPQFEFSPTNEAGIPSTQSLTPMFSTKIERAWVIAPKKDASNEQTMIVWLVKWAEDDEGNRSAQIFHEAEIKLNVITMLGFDFRLWSLVVLIGGVIVSGIGAIKNLSEINKARRPLRSVNL